MIAEDQFSDGWDDIMTWPTLGPACFCHRSETRTPFPDGTLSMQNVQWTQDYKQTKHTLYNLQNLTEQKTKRNK